MSEVLPTYARIDLEFERGDGCALFTAAGERYLDFTSGVAVNALGHANARLIEALTAQASKLWHVSNLFRIPGQEELARKLTEATFADFVFFTNSGAEAVECAIKTARKYFAATGQPERYRLITFEGAFHGRTLATIAATGVAKYLDGFGPKVDGFDQVPLGDLAAVKTAITPETAGILIEPVQGEGGVRVPPPGFLKALRALADEHGLLLLLDEVQCGMGRTGKLFAHEWEGVTPDIMAVAKGLGGGFPVGACLTTAAAGQGMTAGSHGSTFGGNPLAMAVAGAVLDTMLEDGFLDRVRQAGLAMKQKLARVVDEAPDIFEEVRGTGLLLGLKCKPPAGDVAAALRAQRLLVPTAGENVIRLLPPLVVSDAEIDEAVGLIAKACASLTPLPRKTAGA